MFFLAAFLAHSMPVQLPRRRDSERSPSGTQMTRMIRAHIIARLVSASDSVAKPRAVVNRVCSDWLGKSWMSSSKSHSSLDLEHGLRKRGSLFGRGLQTNGLTETIASRKVSTKSTLNEPHQISVPDSADLVPYSLKRRERINILTPLRYPFKPEQPQPRHSAHYPP